MTFLQCIDFNSAAIYHIHTAAILLCLHIQGGGGGGVSVSLVLPCTVSINPVIIEWVVFVPSQYFV